MIGILYLMSWVVYYVLRNKGFWNHIIIIWCFIQMCHFDQTSKVLVVTFCTSNIIFNATSLLLSKRKIFQFFNILMLLRCTHWLPTLLLTFSFNICSRNSNNAMVHEYNNMRHKNFVNKQHNSWDACFF